MDIFVPGIPASQGSKRHVGNGVMVESSKKLGPWRERVALAVSEVVEGEPTRSTVTVACDFYFARPQSHLRKDGSVRASAPKRPGRPDLDKLVRAVFDALTGIVFQDDGQVVDLVAGKQYGESPGLWLRVINHEEES